MPGFPMEFESSHRQLLEQRGFLCFSKFLSDSEIEQCADAIASTITEFHSSLLRSDPKFELAAQHVGGQRLYSIKKKGSCGQIQCEPGVNPTNTDLPIRVRKLQALAECNKWFESPNYKQRLERSVNALVGEKVVLYDEMALLKPANGGMEVPLHQDTAFMTFSPPNAIVAAWIAIDSSSIDNGCLFVLPQSHTLGPLEHSIPKTGYRNGNENATGTVVVHDGIVNAATYGKETYIELEPGGVVFFMGNLPHGSHRNDSSADRRSLQYHYRCANSEELSRQEYVRRYPGYFGESDRC